MRIYTSYFYQVRFFPQNLIPLSTAIYDPKWFHANQSQAYQYEDGRGVINGIRAEIFNPHNSDCRGPECCTQDPSLGRCSFLLKYKIQLNELDFQLVMQRFENLRQTLIQRKGFNDVNFALLVHEAPYNPCSERVVIQEWFADNGIQVTEWSRELI